MRLDFLRDYKLETVKLMINLGSNIKASYNDSVAGLKQGFNNVGGALKDVGLNATSGIRRAARGASDYINSNIEKEKVRDSNPTAYKMKVHYAMQDPTADLSQFLPQDVAKIKLARKALAAKHAVTDPVIQAAKRARAAGNDAKTSVLRGIANAAGNANIWARRKLANEGSIPSFNKFKKIYAESIDAYSHVISPRNLYSLYVLECAANIYGVKKPSKKHKKS